MRTEVKLAVVVVLVAVIGAASYFLSRGNEKPMELTPAKPPVARVQEMPLPLGPGGGPAVTERSEPRAVTPAAPVAGPKPVTEITRKSVETTPKPVITLDLNPAGEATTKPGKSTARVVPNQPASIDLENTPVDTPTAGNQTGAPGAEPAAATIHVVKPGETLFQIAKHYYGRGDLSKLIIEANHGVNPKTLRAGAKLTIPPAPAAAKAKGTTTTAHTAKAGTPALPANVDPSKAKTYTVKPGENFYRIAKSQLGNGSRWKEIFEMNKAQLKDDPKNLRAGQTIYLPAK